MTGLAELLTLPCGAQFHRADMHVHSYGGSHDVKDTTLTPQNIVDTALLHGLEVLAITDHNEITNVGAALEAARGQNLLVVPGIELSTPQGHLLAYLPELRALEKLHGRLEIVERNTPNSRCQNAVLDCLNHLRDLGGFGILAHVDVSSGFEQANQGASPHKVDVICHPALLGIELKSASSVISYAENDPDPDRANMGRLRITRLGLGEKQFLARVLFSDSHKLEQLGRNAEGNKKVTRAKMDKPSFAALRIALEDADARIRIEDDVPAAVPQILGVRFIGGFLDKQEIHLSPNLNCIIGGRGTGKSTTFEALGCLSETPRSESDVIDSEIWPGELQLYWRDAAGQEHSLQKLTGSNITNLDDGDFGPVGFPLDCYGQGDTTKLGQRAKKDPLALLEYLDGFVDLRDAKAAEAKAIEELRKLHAKIEDAGREVAQIPQCTRDLTNTQQQLKAVEQSKAPEVIALQRKLASELEIRNRIDAQWRDAKALIQDTTLREKLAEITTVATPEEVSVGTTELQKITAAALALDAQVERLLAQIEQHASAFDTSVAQELRAWKAKDETAKRTIEAKRQELEAKGVRLNMAFIQKLTDDEARHKKNLERLNRWKAHITKLRADHARALQARWDARDRVYALRAGYAKTASEALGRSLTDLRVSLKFTPDAYAPEAERLIQETMMWRTIRVPRAALIVQKLTLPKLLQAIAAKDVEALTNLADDNGVRPFDKEAAEDILLRLDDEKTRHALEQCAVHDLPRLLVTKKIERNGKHGYITREFSRLSLGQQQSILLTLLLSSDGNNPLIIDQPEDNLDGEFIYSSFVPVLRRAKERRQIVIVTHNANIAVLGDAEQIVVLKVNNDQGVITERGSIDDEATSKAACSILEGARAAFERRGRMYGIR